MNRLKYFVTGAAAATLMMTGTVSQSFAIEPGDFTNYLRGATQGLPLGALPPPGIYAGFGLNATGLGGSAGKGDQAIPGFSTAPAFGYGINFLYVPGWTFLGASYAMGVVQVSIKRNLRRRPRAFRRNSPTRTSHRSLYRGLWGMGGLPRSL